MIPLAALAGMSFGSLLMAYSATLENEGFEFALIQHALAQHGAEHCVWMGDSSGGGLALVIAQRAVARGLPAAAEQVQTEPGAPRPPHGAAAHADRPSASQAP